MTRRLRSGLLIPACALLLAACATSSRFEWGDYERALYVYSKKPDARPVYREALEKAIAKGRNTKRLAPGLLAELGYLKLEDGDAAGAIALFEEEMRTFPEARPFLNPVVARIKGASQQAAVES